MSKGAAERIFLKTDLRQLQEALNEEVKAESSKHLGGERTNSSGETVALGELRWEGECGNMTSPFVTLGVKSFGNSWGEEYGTIAVGREVQLCEENQHAYFQGYQHDRGPIGSLKWHC